MLNKLKNTWMLLTLKNIPANRVDTVTYLEQVDTIITTTLLSAKQECHRTPNTLWSPQLIESKQHIKYWHLWYQQFTTNQNTTDQCTHITIFGGSYLSSFNQYCKRAAATCICTLYPDLLQCCFSQGQVSRRESSEVCQQWLWQES